MQKYSVRESLATDHGTALAVWTRNVPGVDFAKRYDWYYLNNPYGVFSYLLTDENDSAIGAAGLSARRFHCSGKPQLVGLCSDFSVDVSSRFLIPAAGLQRRVVAKGLERFPFIYGFPNNRAIGVMVRVGYKLLGSVPNYTFVLHTRYYLQRKRVPAAIVTSVDTLIRGWVRTLSLLTSKQALHETNTIDARFDWLWRDASKAMFTGIRDARFLQWRFLRHPIERFRVFVLPDAMGSIRGYAVVSVGENGQWRVVDFLASQSRPAALPTLLIALVQQAFDEGASSLNLEFFGVSGVHRTLRAIGFRRRPHWRQVLVATEDKALASLLSAQCNWYITSADED